MSYTYSFIIPHRDTPHLLERCIDSIPQRDDVEVIVVDDNSTADKQPVLPKREHLRLIRLGKNDSKGAGHARNCGLRVATGEWVLFADADDYYAPSFLEKLDVYRSQDIEVLYFNFEYRDGQTLAWLPTMPICQYLSSYHDTQEGLDEIRFHHKMPWTKMVRKKFLDQHHIFFEESLNGNDIFFSMQVGYFAQKMWVEPMPLYVYLKNANSIVHRTKSPESAYCHILHKIKLNRFYRFVGHSEWRQSALKEFLCKVRLLGLPFLWYVLPRIGTAYRQRNEWVAFFKNHL